MDNRAQNRSTRKRSIVENKDQKEKQLPKKKTPKRKEEKQVIVAPRTRLEPRLGLPSEKKKNVEETVSDVEGGKQLLVSLNANEVGEHFDKVPQVAFPANATSASKVSDAKGVSSSKKKIPKKSSKSVGNYLEDEEDFKKFIKESKQKAICKGFYWTDREIRDLAYALQRYGFGDTAKLAAEVKTKTENDIMAFLKARVMEKRREKAPNFDPDRHRGRPKCAWTSVSPEVLKTWPNIRKWRRLAYEQMLPYTRAKDYSKPVMAALCNKFYEEEPEPEDPQIINTKLIYKYMADCMNGVVPPQLPPKESALVLDLLREARTMPIAYDFEEERNFLKGFKRATNFKPFQVKDEFKKKFQGGPEEDEESNTVSVPDEIFLELSRHKRLLQSFNPLVTPVWMLQKEQEHLQQYYEESSVYVD